MEESQEFWHLAATQGYEDRSKASGQEVSSSLASAARVFWQKPIVPEVLRDKMDKAALPANCSFLVPKRTNSEIWTNLPSYVRSNDVKLQEIQKTHAAAATMILRAASDVTEASKQKSDPTPLIVNVMTSLKEAMSLAGKTSQLLNQLRRDQIKPNLPSNFKKLAVEVDEASEMLFGESVCDRLEAMKRENKLAQMLEKERGQKRKMDKPTPSGNGWSSYKARKGTSDQEGHRHSSRERKQECKRTPARNTQKSYKQKKQN